MTELPRARRPSVPPIDLRLPPDPANAKVLRQAASGVVAMCGYTESEIEEVQLAASEVLIALVQHGSGRPVDVRFVVSAEEIVIEASTPMLRQVDEDHPGLMFCNAVLREVCTEHSLHADHSLLNVTATMRRPFKGLATDDAARRADRGARDERFTRARPG